MSASLPVEYTPLSAEKLKVGQVFESDTFFIHQASHDKTVAALLGSLTEKPRGVTNYLLPGELWGWARALSPTFGRLNEVVLSKATWDIHGTTTSSETALFARTEVLSFEERHGLVFCTTRTETFALDNESLLLSAVDEVLLAHDCNKPFFKEPPPRFVESLLLKNQRYDNEHTVYFRWPWDESDWKNNIHTDSYARECGFERGLPEFVTYIDWIYHAVEESRWFLNREPITIRLTKVLPLYHGETIRVITNREGEQYLHIHFLNKDGAERVTAVAAPFGYLL